jgi:hypothetical protein
VPRRREQTRNIIRLHANSWNLPRNLAEAIYYSCDTNNIEHATVQLAPARRRTRGLTWARARERLYQVVFALPEFAAFSSQLEFDSEEGT